MKRSRFTNKQVIAILREPAETALRERLRVWAGERRRFGRRRLHVLLRREGLVQNGKKTEHLYREERLSVYRRRGRKRAAGARAPLILAASPNTRWRSTSATTNSPRVDASASSTLSKP